MKYTTSVSSDFTMKYFTSKYFTAGYAHTHKRAPTFILTVCGKDISNPIPRKYRNLMRNGYWTVVENSKRQLSRLDRRNKYYINWGRDCDGCESSRSVKFNGAYEAHTFIEEAYNWADGPETWSPCTKEEYEQYQPTFRDLGMEAYENGHPHVLRP